MVALTAFASRADADGPVAPIAVDYSARITHEPVGLDAKIVDGYLTVWLRVPRDVSATVLDYRRVPWVRYDRAGVAVNTNSEEYYLSQVPVPAVPPANLTAATPPHWVRVTSGRAYMWRDGRLHALTTIALPPGATYVGPWSIPVVVDGHRTTISGSIDHRGPPSIVWFWPVVVMLACALAAWRMRLATLDRRLSKGLTAVLLIAIGVAGAARYLHGRPSVTAGELVALALILGGVSFGTWRLQSGRSGYPLLFVVAFASLWAGLTLAPALLHGYVLLALPALLDRVTAVILLGGGAGLILFALRALDSGSRRAAAVLACTCLMAAGCGGAAAPASRSETRPAALSGIPASLLAGLRTVGIGERFHPPATGPVLGRCRRTLGRRIVAHVELFAENHVILIAAAIGTRPPRVLDDARVVRARCFGSVVTLDPTGSVYATAGTSTTIAQLFRSWGEPLSSTRIASFRAPAGSHVSVFIGGRRRAQAPGVIRITDHAEIVLEVGPHVPPHRSFTFPPTPPATMR